MLKYQTRKHIAQNCHPDHREGNLPLVLRKEWQRIVPVPDRQKANSEVPDAARNRNGRGETD
jgi:hypothetical protein